MDGVDPETLLEWLQTGAGDERDLQLMALEQLCMLLLMSDNIDRCFESCPPRSFLPALGKIFLDETAPENILEVTARAITYYLDVSNECTRRITQVEGAVKAICHRLIVADMTDRTSKDLAEQCVKLLEHICQREASVVYEAGGLQCMLHLICQNDQHIHKDTMHSAMAVITRLCSKVDPQDANLAKCSSDLGVLLSHDDAKISECALRCFAALTDRFIRKSLDPADLATPSNLVEHLLGSLVPSLTSTVADENPGVEVESNNAALHQNVTENGRTRSSAFISVVLSLLSNLCRGSMTVTNQVTRSPKLIPAIKSVLRSKDERCVMDSLRLADLLIILLCEGRVSLPKASSAIATLSTNATPSIAAGFDRTHRHLIDAIRQRDTDALIDAVENGSVDSNFIDDVGQTLLNWCSAFGSSDMVIYLCDKGADPNKGQRSSSLHYAACFGRPDIIKILLQHGANPDLHDEEGRTALDKARERNDEGHQQVVQILESPGSYSLTPSHGCKLKPVDSAAEGDLMTPKSQNKSEERKLSTATSVDLTLSKLILQQLVPIFCDIFQNSLMGSVRRSTLLLIRKCVLHLSNEGLFELVNMETAEISNNDIKQRGCDFVENLMGVLVTVFDYEDDIEGKEQALLIMKYLLVKDKDFWLEQIIRLGVYEKVETLTNGSLEVEGTKSSIKPSLAAAKIFEDSVDMDVDVQSDVLEAETVSSNSSVFDTNDEKLENRSSSLAPSLTSMSTKLDQEVGNLSQKRVHDERAERFQMLNIPVESDTIMSGEITTTPSPTVEIGDNEQRKSITPTRLLSSSTNPASRISSQFASVRADLVEAATAVAQALGVQIVDDPSPGTSLSGSTNALVIPDGNKGSDSEDAWTLTSGVNYKWNDWRLIRNKDSLFIWCDAVAIEFSDGSNGWLRFLMDGKLSTMYSSGSAEAGTDDSDSRSEFIGKIQKAKAAVPSGSQTKTIFSKVRAKKKIESGNWQIASAETDHLVLTNIEGGNGRLVIKADLPGFVFESGKNNTQLFSAESTLGLDFVTGWAARGGGRRLRFRVEAQRLKLHELAKELWDNYLKEAKTKPRDALIMLQEDAAQIDKLTTQICEAELNSSDCSNYVLKLNETLTRVRNAISNERLLSTFEISISNIVPSFLSLLKAALEDNSKVIAKCFSQVFSHTRDFNALVRRIVLVLESCEKFAQQLYDAPGGSPFGLQLLTRRFSLRMELADPDDQKSLLNRTDRTMKIEPLVTVGALRQYIYGMVSKQWYDYSRDTLYFVKQIKALKERAERLELKYVSDFDTNGLIWYLGTNGRSVDEWSNPAVVKVVNVCSSDDLKHPYGQPSDILSRDTNSLSCHTTDSPDSNFTLDLGVWLYPNAYTLRHAQGYGKSALRNWFLQASRDNYVWHVLVAHSDDQSLNECGSTATWPIDNEDLNHGPYRYFRIAQNGKNASGTSYVLSLSGFEIYGSVVDVVENELKPFEALPTFNCLSKPSKTSQATPLSTLLSGTKKSKQKTSGISVLATSSKELAANANRGTTLSNLHYSRPPTAASIRHSRKQKIQKSGNDKVASNTTGFDLKVDEVEGLSVDDLKHLSNASTNTKLRMLRSNRNRTSNIGNLLPSSVFGHGISSDSNSVVDENGSDLDHSNPLPMAPPSTAGPFLKVGTHVVPGQDWPWGNQNNEMVGTVIDVGKSGNGWVDVQWYDGSINTYRFGHEGKFDIEPQNEANSKSHALVLTPCQRGKTVNVVPNTPSKASNELNTLKSAKHFSKTTDVGRFTNLNAIDDEDNEQLLPPQQNAELTMVVPSVTTTTSTISQKSMSATNLFDEHQKPSRYSVASTNQAASAESLQHQTPSLENLLARSRIYADRIPEINDEQQSPTLESRLFDRQDVCQKSDVDGLKENSVAANTFTGGSQPVLSISKELGFHVDFAQTFTSAISEEENSRVATTNNETTENKSKEDKSKSEPDLATSTESNQFCDKRHKSLVPSIDTTQVEKDDLAEETLRTPSQTSLFTIDANSTDAVKDNESNDLKATDKAIATRRKSSSVIEELSSSVEEFVNVDYIDQFLDSPEFRRRLVHAYTDDSNRTQSNSQENTTGLNATDTGLSSGDLQEVDQGFLSKYVEEAILQEFLSEHDLTNVDHNKIDIRNRSNEERRAGANASTSSAHERALDSSTVANRRQLSNIGLGLRLKLGNYAEVLKGMMQQVIDSSGIIAAGFDQDDLSNEIFDDEMLSSQNALEENCDNSIGGFSNQNFAVEVESLAAAAILRQHFSSGAVDSNGSNPITASSTLQNTEPKLDWRQMFVGSSDVGSSSTMAQRVFGNLPSGSVSFGFMNKSNRGNAEFGSIRSEKRMPRVWDDDYVLRRQFGALIPAFDPRPGRTNTQEVELSDDTNVKYTRKGSVVKQLYTLSPLPSDNDFQRIRLYLKGPNLSNVENQLIELKDDSASFFSYIQELSTIVEWKNKTERSGRVWESTYTIVYDTVDSMSPVVKEMLDKSSIKLHGKDEFEGLVKESMDLIKFLHEASKRFAISVSEEPFHSLKLTQKFTQCLTDPMIVSAAALPHWCTKLVFDYPCLFSMETRSMHLRATAFGISRAIAWLQSRRDQILDQNRLSGGVASSFNMAGSRREDHYPEYRIGRIKHERIKVHRNDDLLMENAIKVMNFHAMRKSILEIEYFCEEGTGLGPTLEFFALVSAEFQRKSLAMWLCDDSDVQQTELESDYVDLGEGRKPPGYYIRRSGGLFPAYLPQDCADCAKASNLFKIFGIFLAKVLQDCRLVDIPLSPIFLKLVLSLKVSNSDEFDLESVLDIDDLEQIYPLKAAFLRSLQDLIRRKHEILESKHLNDAELSNAISALRLTLNENVECTIEDLALTFVINPPSKVFTYNEVELIENGANVDVTINNVEEYVEKCLNFYLNLGIRQQILAFREGFDLVFPMKSLSSFTSKEVQILLFGEQCPQWTRDEVLKYTEPKLGYTRDSLGFQHFVNVLVDLNAQERKAFLQFTTGCSSLPPGGLANLHPRLTVVRKVDAGDGSYPSVNTCVHYLKLPEYSCVEVLRERLLNATFEKGFHLN